MRMLDFLHKAAAIKVFEFANSYGIRWQGFVQTLQVLCSSGRLYWSDRVEQRPFTRCNHDMLSCRFGEVDAYGKAGHRGTPT